MSSTPAWATNGIPDQHCLCMKSYSSLLYIWNPTPAWSTYRIPCQLNLHIEFNASWVYIERPHLKKKPKLNLTKPNIVILYMATFSVTQDDASPGSWSSQGGASLAAGLLTSAGWYPSGSSWESYNCRHYFLPRRTVTSTGDSTLHWRQLSTFSWRML